MRIAVVFLIFLMTASVGLLAQKRLLIYTHNGEGFVHDNISASVEALQKLAAENGYEIQHTDAPSFFTPENLKGIDCIIFSNSNNEAFTSQSQRDAFQKYIQSGGGFVGIHSASGSERDWPWFWAMLGGKFVRHPELQSFEMKVMDHANPATSFLEDIWKWEDECYYFDHLNPDIHILLAADLSTIEDMTKTNFHGNKDFAPIAWVHEYDGGRQFFTALGHKSEYYQGTIFLKHLLGGIKWVLNED